MQDNARILLLEIHVENALLSLAHIIIRHIQSSQKFKQAVMNDIFCQHLQMEQFTNKS